jgi:hypothetical protein
MLKKYNGLSLMKFSGFDREMIDNYKRLKAKLSYQPVGFDLFAKRCFFQIGEFILHHFRQRN